MSFGSNLQPAAAVAQSPAGASHSSSLSSSICSTTSNSSRFPPSSAQTSPHAVESTDQNHRSNLSSAAEELHQAPRGMNAQAVDTMSSVAVHAGPSNLQANALNVPTESRGRPASKTRRTNAGGSRVPSEERDGRSDSGSDRRHSIKERNGGLGENGFFQQASSAATNGADASHSNVHLDLATFPPQDLLRVLAALLQQIAAANDQLRPQKGDGGAGNSDADSPLDAQSRRRRRKNDERGPTTAAAADPEMALSVNLAEDKSHSQFINGKPTSAATSALHTPSSTLCFRARNVPSISIEAYLLRILRYCPASCEVFVSLLVYFDRMSKMGQKRADGGKNRVSIDCADTPAMEDTANGEDYFVGMQGFAIDSFNVHRLVIAGVTVASKFFSDVFYTNSRYAKVGGLPVHELNQLELQFLLLNDFSLMIPLEEMQRYANQLLVYGGGGAGSASSSVTANAAESSNEQQSRGRSMAQKDANGDVSMYER